MKRILIALLVMMTIFSLANAQKQTTIVNDSTGNVKVTVTKGKGKDAKVNVGNTAVTVIGIDDEDADTTSVDTGKVSSSSRGSHGKASFTISSDDDDFPFNNFGNAVGGGILVAIISIIAIFGMPVFIIFVVFFFRYKNRKARYRLAEQAIAAGQPLPENFIRENRPADQRSQGIKNTFTGIGLFIFLWAITGEFGIGAIGLLIMFMGIGQWIIGSKQQKTDDIDPFRMNVSRKRDIDTRNNSAAGNNFGTRNDPPTGNNFDAAAPSATQQEERNGEKSDENK